MSHYKTVNCLVMYRELTLLLKRSSSVRVNPRLWSTVSGRVEGRVSLEKQAYNEILEETGIERSKLLLIRRGKTYTLKTKPSGHAWVTPFLFESKTKRIRLNWENTDFRWIRLGDLHRFELVPRFDLNLKSLKLQNETA